MKVTTDTDTKRTYDVISTVLICSMPSRDEIRAMTDKEIKKLCNLSNILDNIAYLEIKRRESGVAK